MLFKRIWDSECPRIYDSWETDGIKFVIQDLPPEDEEEAMTLLVENMCTDEVLCSLSGMTTDKESMRSMCDFWRKYLKERMSLACYAEVDGMRELAALNVCYVTNAAEQHDDKIEGEAWQNVYNVLAYMDNKIDVFKYLGFDTILYAVGLVVKRKFRGFKLGARVLAAREPLVKPFGIKGTSTVFTGPASQKCAAKAGFTTVLTVPMTELVDAGLKYPRDADRFVKVMVKKYE